MRFHPAIEYGSSDKANPMSRSGNTSRVKR